MESTILFGSKNPWTEVAPSHSGSDNPSQTPSHSVFSPRSSSTRLTLAELRSPCHSVSRWEFLRAKSLSKGSKKGQWEVGRRGWRSIHPLVFLIKDRKNESIKHWVPPMLLKKAEQNGWCYSESISLQKIY